MFPCGHCLKTLSHHHCWMTILSLYVLKVFAMDIAKQLEAYEVEYHVLQEEMSTVCRGSHRGLSSDTSNRVTRLRIENEALRRQKTELLDQIQVTHVWISSLWLIGIVLFHTHCIQWQSGLSLGPRSVSMLSPMIYLILLRYTYPCHG